MVRHTIIIPTADRPVAIKSALASLLACSPYEHDAEIVVVDNNMAPELSADLESYCRSLDGLVRYCREPIPGLSAARHRGVSEARGNLLTFIDDDVEVASGWLASIQRGFSDANVAMVGGPSIPKFTGSVPAWFWGFLSRPGIGGWMCGWLSLLDIGRDVPDIDPSYIWGLNFSIRRPVLEKCGGFNPDLVPAQYQRWQGDGETGLANKVRSAGLRAVYMQDAMLMHHCGPDRLNIEYFRKRAYYQGVCDSFSHIRDGHPPLSTLAPGKDAFLFHGFRRATRKAVASLLGEKTLWHGDHAPVKIVTDKAYLDGWSFHQREVAADAALLEWVRRASYIGANFRTEGKP